VTSAALPSAEAAASASVTPAPPLPELPPALELSGKLACTFKTLRFQPTPDAGTLLLGKEGPAFARVTGGEVAVTIPNGKTDVAILEARSEGIVVSGIIRASAIELQPTTPFVMAGFVPNPRTRLSFTSAEDDTISLRLALPKTVVAAKGAVEETRPCSNVGFDLAQFETQTPVFGTRKGAGRMISGGPAPISLKPDDASVATLVIPPAGELVFAFEEQAGRTLIAWETHPVLVFGWVRSGRLTPTNGGRGSSLDGGVGRSTGRGETPVAFVQCRADVPLIAAVKDEQKTVGRILSGTTIGVGAWGDPLSRVVVRTASMHAWAGGSFSARTAELKRCREVAGKPAAPP